MRQIDNTIEAFILAAGYGSRLRPLTNQYPKPLVPFLGQPILFHILDQLLSFKIYNVTINAHYLWNKIDEAIIEIKKLI